MSVTWQDLAPFFIVVIGSGGIIGGVATFIKARPEAGKIAVDAAEGAVIVQTSVITTLRQENDQLRARLENLESQVALMAGLAGRVDQLENERKTLHAERTRLRNRVTQLETKLRDLNEALPEPPNGG